LPSFRLDELLSTLPQIPLLLLYFKKLWRDFNSARSFSAMPMQSMMMIMTAMMKADM
jgi:hypothetical protein